MRDDLISFARSDEYGGFAEIPDDLWREGILGLPSTLETLVFVIDNLINTQGFPEHFSLIYSGKLLEGRKVRGHRVFLEIS